MKDPARCDLLILDEFGYVLLDIENAWLLFQVVSAHYDRSSVIFITNIEFSKWAPCSATASSRLGWSTASSTTGASSNSAA